MDKPFARLDLPPMRMPWRAGLFGVLAGCDYAYPLSAEEASELLRSPRPLEESGGVAIAFLELPSGQHAAVTVNATHGQRHTALLSPRPSKWGLNLPVAEACLWPRLNPGDALALCLAEAGVWWEPYAALGFPAGHFSKRFLEGASGHAVVTASSLASWLSEWSAAAISPVADVRNPVEKERPYAAPAFTPGQPFIGFRCWLNSNGELRALTSGSRPLAANPHFLWEKKGFSLAAHKYACPGRATEAVPCAGGCGLHAYGSLRLAAEAFGSFLMAMPRRQVLPSQWNAFSFAIGAVQGCGRCAVHGAGFRAAAARPLALLEPYSLLDMTGEIEPLAVALPWAVEWGLLGGMSTSTRNAAKAYGIPVLPAGAIESHAAEFGSRGGVSAPGNP